MAPRCLQYSAYHDAHRRHETLAFCFLDLPTVKRYTVENAKDILAFAFNPLKTFMFSNLDFVGGAFYQNIIRVARMIKNSDIRQALGFEDEQNVGMFYCCLTQSAGFPPTPTLQLNLSASHSGRIFIPISRAATR